MVNKNTGIKKLKNIDVSLLFYVFILVLFGLIMIYSTTVYKEGYESIISQLAAVVIGTVAMFFVAVFSFKKIPGLWLIVHIVACVSIIMLMIPGVRQTINGATRWFKIGPLPSVQSAEIVKLCLILLLAHYLTTNPEKFKKLRYNLRAWAIVIIYAGVLGAVSQNLSSAIIIGGIGAIMIFIALPHTKLYLIIFGSLAAIAGLIVVLVYFQVIDLGFRGSRILVWLDLNGEKFDVDNYQTLQALYAIGSGGIKGKGIGEGIQKINKIPEAQNDMIFAVLCEELGLVGAFIVMVVFACLISRLISHAKRLRDPYNKLIVVGVAAQIALQSILNIAVVTNSIPNTGVSLPFISCGGSSVLCLLVEIGLVLNVTGSLNFNERY